MRRIPLPVLTNSSITTFRRCPREYQFRYVMLRKGLRKSAALKFGSLFHRGLNAWWSSKLDRFDAALVAMREHLDGKEETDAFEMVKAETLIAGYGKMVRRDA